MDSFLFTVLTPEVIYVRCSKHQMKGGVSCPLFCLWAWRWGALWGAGSQLRAVATSGLTQDNSSVAIKFGCTHSRALPYPQLKPSGDFKRSRLRAGGECSAKSHVLPTAHGSSPQAFKGSVWADQGLGTHPSSLASFAASWEQKAAKDGWLLTSTPANWKPVWLFQGKWPGSDHRPCFERLLWRASCGKHMKKNEQRVFVPLHHLSKTAWANVSSLRLSVTPFLVFSVFPPAKCLSASTLQTDGASLCSCSYWAKKNPSACWKML